MKKKKPVDMSFDITGSKKSTKPTKPIVRDTPLVPKKTTIKKRRVEPEVEPQIEKKPLKKKRRTDLVLVDGKDQVTFKGQKISKIDQKEMLSIIGDDAEEMQQLFEGDNTEQATKMLNRRLIQMLIDLIPQLETGIRKSNGRYGVHSLNGTIQTIRELVIDMQSAQDRGALGHSIVENIIKPVFYEIATIVVEEASMVLSEVKDVLPPEGYAQLRRAQIDSRNRLASSINTKYLTVKDEIIGFLQR